MVHVLRYGLALCGQLGFPRNWPPGDRWVAFYSIEEFQHITCLGCFCLLKEGVGRWLERTESEKAKIVLEELSSPTCVIMWNEDMWYEKE